MPDLKEEIPAFLRFLSERVMKTTYTGSRMWFLKEQLETEALKRVIQFSKPTLEKELRTRLKEMFLDSGVREIRMSISDIWQDFFGKKYEHQYIERLLKENLKVSNVSKPQRYEYPKRHIIYENGIPQEQMILVKKNGRPFIFNARDFLTTEEVNGLEINDEIASIMPRDSQGQQAATEQIPLDLNENSDGMPF